MSTPRAVADACRTPDLRDAAAAGGLRLAFIVHSFDAGGLERCVARLASRLDGTRFRSAIVCLARNGTAAQWLERSDIPVYEMHRKAGHDPGLILRLARLLRSERIQLVHSHNWGSLLEAVLARKLAGVPIHVHAERGLELAELQAGPWRRLARERVAGAALRSAQAVVTVSEELRRRALASGVPARLVHLIPNGIDALAVGDPLAARAGLREELGIADSMFVVCCVGRLVPVKNLRMVIEAAALLQDRGLTVHLVLVGDGPERATLEALAHSLGIPRQVHFVGERRDIGAWLAAVDVFVNCSLYEGMSQAVLEAMAAGLPLVVTDVGENATLAGGPEPCGMVVPSGDAAGMSAALGELARDPMQRARLGRRARARQREEYSQERMILRYEALYDGLVSATGIAAGSA